MANRVAVGLADALDALRGELTEAIRRGQAQRMQFQLDPVELTIQVAITKDASGKIGWTVLGLGGSYQAASTQTLKLELTPLWKKTDGTLVKDFTVIGDLDRDEQWPRTP